MGVQRPAAHWMLLEMPPLGLGVSHTLVQSIQHHIHIIMLFVLLSSPLPLLSWMMTMMMMVLLMIIMIMMIIMMIMIMMMQVFRKEITQHTKCQNVVTEIGRWHK